MSYSTDENTNTLTISGTFPEYMREIFERSIDNLTPEQGSELTKLLIRFADVFAKHDLYLGCLKGVKHSINVGNHSPIK